MTIIVFHLQRQELEEKKRLYQLSLYIYKLRNIQCKGTEEWKRSSKRRIFTIGTPEIRTTSAAKENKGEKKSLQMRNLYDTQHTSIHSWKRLLWTTIITSTEHFKVVFPLYLMRPIPFSFTLLLSLRKFTPNM